MTIINTYLGQCPHCLRDSITTRTLSTSSFCISIKGTYKPSLVTCPVCKGFAWSEEVLIVDQVDFNDKSHSWWLEADESDCIKVLKSNQVNGKKLTNAQRHNLEAFLLYWKSHFKKALLQDHVEGCLRGLSYADIDGGTSNMTLLVFQSLIENKNIGVDKVDYSDIGRRYLKWYNNNAVDTGMVNAMVFDLVNKGATFEDASKEVDRGLHGMTASSRPACRSLPISAYLAGVVNKNPDVWKVSGSNKIITKFIEQEVKLTHRHVHTSQISIAVNIICMCLMLSYSLNESVKNGADFISPKTRRSLGLTSRPIPITKKDLKNTGYADDALIAAIWFIRNTNSFDEAVKESLKLKGKANYCSTLVGAIGGALYGYNDIKNTIDSHGDAFKSHHIEYLTSGV